MYVWDCMYFNTTVLNFVPQIVLALASQNSFSWFLYPFNIPPSLWVFSLFFKHCLASWHDKMLQDHLVAFLPHF